MTTFSPFSISSKLTTTSFPSLITLPVSGTKSKRALIEWRVFSIVFASKNEPSINRYVTAAASQYSPIINAPVVAMVTKASIPTILNFKAPKALLKIGQPAKRVDTTIKMITAKV